MPPKRRNPIRNPPPQAPAAPEIVLHSSFDGRPIHPELQINVEEFRDDDACKPSLAYIAQCGHSRIFQPAREYYYPRLVRFFWQAVRLTPDGLGLVLPYGDQAFDISVHTIADAAGYTRVRPRRCPYPAPSLYKNMPKVVDVARIIGSGKTSRFSRNNLTKRELIFLDTVLKAAVHPPGHERDRRRHFLHTLYDLHHNRWFSVTSLIMAGMRRCTKTLRSKHLHTKALHYPHLITAILEQIQFPIPPEEEKTEEVCCLLYASWRQSYYRPATSRPTIAAGPSLQPTPPMKRRRGDDGPGPNHEAEGDDEQQKYHPPDPHEQPHLHEDPHEQQYSETHNHFAQLSHEHRQIVQAQQLITDVQQEIRVTQTRILERLDQQAEFQGHILAELQAIRAQSAQSQQDFSAGYTQLQRYHVQGGLQRAALHHHLSTVTQMFKQDVVIRDDEPAAPEQDAPQQ